MPSNIYALGCTPTIISDAVSCSGTSVPASSFLCGGIETSFRTVSNLIGDGVLLNAFSALTTPQYVVLFGEVIVDIDYHFAPGSVIIFAKSSFSPINNEGFTIDVNRTFNLDNVLMTSFKENLFFPCSTFYYEIIPKDYSKIHFVYSTIKNIYGITPLDFSSTIPTPYSMEYVYIDHCTFYCSNLIRPVEGSNLTFFEIKNSKFYADPFLGNNGIWVFNYGGTAVIHNNYFEYFGPVLNIVDVDVVLYSKNEVTISEPMRIKNTTIEIFNNNYHHNLFGTSSTFENSNVKILDSDLEDRFDYKNATSKYFICNNTEFKGNTEVFSNSNCNINISDCKYHTGDGTFRSLYLASNVASNILVYKNQFFNNYEYDCIDIRNNNGAIIRENEFHNTSPDIFSKAESGISLHLADYLRIEGNSFYGVINTLSGYDDWSENAAIEMNSSRNNKIHCNNFNGYDSQMQFINDCSPTNLLHNKFGVSAAGNYGLHLKGILSGLLWIPAKMGPQYLKMNEWISKRRLDALASLGSTGVYDGTVNTHSSITTTLWTNPNYPVSHLPLSPTWVTAIGIWPSIESYGCVYEEDPRDPEKLMMLYGTEDRLEIMQNIINDISILSSDGYISHMAYNILRDILEYSELLEFELFNDFYNIVMSTPFGELTEVHHNMYKNLTSLTVSFDYNNTASSELMLQYIESIDSDDVNYKIGLLSEIQSIINEQIAFLGTNNNAIAAEYNSLLSTLQNIVPENEIQTSLHSSTKYFLETLAYNSSSVSEQELLNVANTCYTDNGYGTLMARSLLNLKIFMPENCDVESKGPGIQNTTEINNQNSDAGFVVYPSYFTNEISWKFERYTTKEYQFNIISSLGVVILTGNISGLNGSLNLESLSSGTYWFRLIDSETNEEYTKMIIKN